MFARAVPCLLVLMPAAGLVAKPQVELIFSRMSKTGSSTGELMLKEALPAGSFKVVNEASGLPAADKQKKKEKKAFVIGMIRNPCQVYLSNWAMYASTTGINLDRLNTDLKVRADTAQCWGNNGEFLGLGAPDYGMNLTSPKNVELFRKWMKNPYTEGMNAYRFAWKWLDGKYHDKCTTCGPKGCADLHETSTKLMQAWSPDQLADCWVKTENYENDFRTCLEKFEAKAGKKMVNWAKFAEEIKKQNKGSYGDCKKYFDKSTAALVEQGIDKPIFEKFGYSGCCA